MCGITGIMAFNEIGRMHMIHLAQATDALKHRGPDYQNTLIAEKVAVGHRRLSVIDTSPKGHQPMTDPSGRYTIIYNGEIYNFKDLRKELLEGGLQFQSESDTEVLLHLFIQQGKECLNRLNGCFAFAVYDNQQEELFLARDRMGINPLLYYQDEDKFVFASEMKSLLKYNIPKSLDHESLFIYLQLNYIPGPFTILEGVKKLMPGHYMTIGRQGVHIHQFYQISYQPERLSRASYSQQKDHLKDLLERAVKDRLLSDVPLGAFLSGGIDSSVVVALASRHQKHLHTFSIGFKDQPFFDETRYAQMVAKKFGTDHTVFTLTDQELYSHLFEVWDHLDEPFADSSALPTYILSKYTRRSVTVALSGDGADELFAGYNKHSALLKTLNNHPSLLPVRILAPLAGFLPKSRHRTLPNKFRQLDRLAKGISMPLPDRYWYWAGVATAAEAAALLSHTSQTNMTRTAAEGRRLLLLKHLRKAATINDVLLTDMHVVLPYDMLTKVDLMSMAHGLEVRVPFLDHRVVEFAFNLPVDAKINGSHRKRIVRDAFREVLPAPLYHRGKRGFEVPLLPWMRRELQGTIEKELLNDDFVRQQDIFDASSVKMLKKQLFTSNSMDSPARLWALLVFQNWYQKYFL